MWLAAGRWDHTATLITHIRAALGDKAAKFQNYHPDYAAQRQQENRRLFRELSRNTQAAEKAKANNGRSSD